MGSRVIVRSPSCLNGVPFPLSLFRFRFSSSFLFNLLHFSSTSETLENNKKKFLPNFGKLFSALQLSSFCHSQIKIGNTIDRSIDRLAEPSLAQLKTVKLKVFRFVRDTTTWPRREPWSSGYGRRLTF